MIPVAELDAAWRGRSILLDGGLGTALEAGGADVGSALWSARVLLDEPERVLAAHRAFFSAGARVAITASYQVSESGFAAAGLGRRLAEEALVTSVRLAQQARDEIAADGTPRWVAASVGPYGASLADGSEYRGDDALTREALEEWHRPRLRTLVTADPDLLAVETIPSLREVRAVVAALDGASAWVCVSVSEGRTAAGDGLEETFAAAADCDEVVAVGVNCCSPDEVLGAILAARRVTGKPVVAYPNSGEQWDAGLRRWGGAAAFDPALVASWREAGADLVGGCCRIGPQRISDLARDRRAR